jgi:hypothetical protein
MNIPVCEEYKHYSYLAHHINMNEITKLNINLETCGDTLYHIFMILFEWNNLKMLKCLQIPLELKLDTLWMFVKRASDLVIDYLSHVMYSTPKNDILSFACQKYTDKYMAIYKLGPYYYNTKSSDFLPYLQEVINYAMINGANKCSTCERPFDDHRTLIADQA